MILNIDINYEVLIWKIQVVSKNIFHIFHIRFKKLGP